LLFLPPALRTDSDFRLAPENQIIPGWRQKIRYHTKLENLIFNQRGAANCYATYLLLASIFFVPLPFEFFQKRSPHKVGDANQFMPRCALNFEENGVRYAGLDRSAVGSRKYFTALALSKGVHSPLIDPRYCKKNKQR
jgi:hypothetical protein